MSNLIELAARCEAADGPDRELDYSISVAIGKGCVRPDKLLRENYAEETGGFTIPRYTTSLDAAMQLVPDGWHIAHSGEGRFLTRGKFVVTLETWGVEQADDGSDIHTTPDRRHGIAETFPLALCAASLRARAADTRTQPRGDSNG